MWQCSAATYSQTKSRRLVLATRVAVIVDHWWASSKESKNFAVLDDMNDYLGTLSALLSLLAPPKKLVIVVDRLPESDQWRLFWNSGDKYSQLDYLMLSKTLAEANPGLPGIMHKGLPRRANRYASSQFSVVAQSAPKASDYAVLFMDMELL